ncbi:MAG: hypothetical protein V7731_18035 [Amphritea sp.]
MKSNIHKSSTVKNWPGFKRHLAVSGYAAMLILPVAGAWAGSESSKLTGTDYYFPGVKIDELKGKDLPQNCFFRAWYAGNEFAYSKTVPLGSGNNPDTWVSYLPAKFKLPAGATLVIKGQYAHNRYMGIDTYAGAFPIAATDGVNIEPDPGSTNTYRPGADREAKDRDWTLRIVDQVRPDNPEANTLYVKSPNPNLSIYKQSTELRFRSYFPDRGQDVLGGVELPRLHRLEFANGTTLNDEEDICQRINLNNTEGELTETALPKEAWNAMVAQAPNPARAPAQETPLWERYFNAPYSLFGIFLLPGGEETRARIPAKGAAGGGGSMAGTVANAYVATYLSHETAEREVAVSYIKLPNTPKTYDAEKRLESNGPLQAQYWSICTNVDPVGYGLTEDGFPTGVRQGMCHNDQTVVINEERYTRIVHSMPDKRPSNATNACGWSWLSSGQVDNLGRPVTQVLMRPNLSPEADFAQSSSNVIKPGTEAEVMGPYLPVTKYMSVAEFETLGCDNNGFAQPAGRPDLPAPIWGTEQTIKPVYQRSQLEPGSEVPTKFFGILKLLGSLIR